MLLLAAPYHVLILLLRLIMVVAASGLHAPATRGNRKVARWGLVVALVCASMIPTATASEVASTCSGDVATCVANAADGATIKIATGTHAWSTEVTVQNKRVTIVGAGEALTILDRNQGGRFMAQEMLRRIRGRVNPEDTAVATVPYSSAAADKDTRRTFSIENRN